MLVKNLIHFLSLKNYSILYKGAALRVQGYWDNPSLGIAFMVFIDEVSKAGKERGRDNRNASDRNHYVLGDIGFEPMTSTV